MPLYFDFIKAVMLVTHSEIEVPSRVDGKRRYLARVLNTSSFHPRVMEPVSRFWWKFLPKKLGHNGCHVTYFCK